MGMKTTASSQVEKLDGVTILDEGRRAKSVPSERSVYWLSLDIKGLGHVLEEPDVVLVLVGVECDLLLLAASGIHEVVGMQVSSLSVVVSDAHSATKSNIDWDILHSLGVKRGLELRAHESISITRVNQAKEVDSKHGHVECDWNNNKAEHSRYNMLGKDAL